MWYNSIANRFLGDLNNDSVGKIMKRKHLLSVLALALCATTLVACSGSQTVTVSKYWQSNVNLPARAAKETLEYDVTYEQLTNSYNYTMSYTNGKYKTELTYEEHQDGTATYTYKTDFTICVTYTVNGESVDFDDYARSKVVFQSENNNFKPVSSEKSVYTHSPIYDTVESAAVFNDIYTKATIQTTYGESNTSTVIETVKDRSEGAAPNATVDVTNTYEFWTDGNYTFVDNDQLLFALRGVNPSINTSPNFQIYAALQNQTQIVNATFEKVETSKFTFALNGEAAAELDISYYPVSLSLQQANNGQPQTVWYAKTTDAANNTYRNVMLYMETPVFANNGSLCYKLKKADFMNI